MLNRSGLLCAVLWCGQAFAGSFSFTGTFAQDDQKQLFTFTLAAPGNVVIKTLGYAGGSNFAGNTISAGGFDPVLTVFSGTGPSASFFDSNNDAGCGSVGQDPTTNACWDSEWAFVGLPDGIYTVVLTQSDNFRSGPTLGDGFDRDGQGNFTGPAFFGGPGSFIDANAAQRNGNWAVDILNVDDASIADVPEPATLGIAGLGLALLIARRIRR